jgi:hypothetical protein
MAIWNVLWTFGIFYEHLVHFLFIWYIFSSVGIMSKEKSGNPVLNVFFGTMLLFRKYKHTNNADRYPITVI